MQTSKKINGLYPFAIFVAVILFNLSYFNRYFPLSEGWWETYGYLINRGMSPGRDFGLAFPPLIPYLNSLYLHIVGLDFYSLRLIGVLIHGLIGFLVYFWLRNFVGRMEATLATTVALMLSISNPTFIAKDYHTYVDLLLVLSLLVGAALVSPRNLSLAKGQGVSARWIAGVIGLGGALGPLFLLKQNIAIFATAGFATMIFIAVRRSGRGIAGSVAFVALLLTTVAFVASGLGVLANAQSFVSAYQNNDAKGNAITVLTRFIADPFNRQIIASAAIMLLAYYFWDRVFLKYKKFFNFLIDKINQLVSQKNNVFIIASIIVALTVSPFLQNLIQTGVLSFSLAYIVANGGRLLSGSYRSNGELGANLQAAPLIMLAYCNTHTAGFNSVGMFFPIGFALAMGLNRISSVLSQKSTLLVIFIFAAIPGYMVGKLAMPYNWWGLTQPSIFKATYSLPYQELAGLKVDRQTFEAYSRIKEVIEKYSKSEQDVFLYPDIPIFYALHHKIPPYKSVVQWFDVLTTEEGLADIERFKNAPASLVIWLRPPSSVYRGHAELKKKPLVMTSFDRAIESELSKGTYELLSVSIIDTSFQMEVPETGNISSARVMVLHKDAICKKPHDVLSPDLFGLTGVNLSVQSASAMPRNQCMDDSYRFHFGEEVRLTANNQFDLYRAIDKLGIPFDLDKYALIILRRVK